MSLATKAAAGFFWTTLANVGPFSDRPGATLHRTGDVGRVRHHP